MKTPNFNIELNKILETLTPHERACLQCQNSFQIFQEDIDFYKKLQVPPPKLCPDCRMQRRFGFYNNILKFHRKNCEAHPEESVITTFPLNSPFKIYDLKYWWSDKWGAEDFGRDYDLNKPFFEQFQELNLNVPQSAITHYWKNVIDSPYTTSIIDSKNCYFSSVGGYLENAHYMYWVGTTRDSLDCLNSQDLENCYVNLDCDKNFNCKFMQNCEECIDSTFLFDCKNCSNCFGCGNLRNKQYCFFNEQLSKDNYLEKIKKINTGDREVLQEYKNKFSKIFKKSVKKNLQNDINNVNCIGDKIEKSRNCFMSFRIAGWGSNDNLRYCQDVADSKDSMDMYIVGPNIELSYELLEAYEGSGIKFSYFTRDGLNLEYCLACHNCQNCFGCIGLRNKKFHIFNKAYSEEEYWNILDKIKTNALRSEEYGEFFPLSMALHAYNDSYASIEFPLTKQEVEANGWIWHADEEINTEGIELIKTEDIPKDIKDVTDDILNKAIICEKSGKPFKLIKWELEFYRANNLPVPTIHPQQRIVDRLKERNPSKLWKMNCKKCGKEMHTAYPPEKQKEYIIYCGECYKAEVL